MIDPIQLSSQYHWRSILSRIPIRSRPGHSTGPSKPGDKLRALQSLRSNKKREKSLQFQEEIPMKNWRNPWRSQWKTGKSWEFYMKLQWANGQIIEVNKDFPCLIPPLGSQKNGEKTMEEPRNRGGQIILTHC